MSYTGKNPKFDSTILKDESANSVSNPAASSHKIVNRSGKLVTKSSSGAESTQKARPEANIAAIKAIGTTERQNGDIAIDVSTYNLYCFQSASSATNDDDFVLQPDAGSGRWLKFGKSALKAAQFDDLSPTTTKGDIIVNDGTNNTRLGVGANGLVLKVNSSEASGLEWGSASSGSGEVNYISNFDGEDTSTTGYDTYDDGSTAIPIDGTGGTATNLVFSNSTANILRGNRSFRLTKSGSADCQGMGFSQDFTIPSWEPPRKSKIEFSYDASDANYTAGDLVVYIYDVTNGVLITPVDTSIPNNSDIFQTSFNTVGGGSYRFIVHCSTTSTNNWSVYFDRIIVGPGMTSQGAASGPVNTVDIDGTDFTNDTGLTIDGRVSYQRVGDSLHVIFSVETNGTGTDGGNLTFDLAGAIGESITFISGSYGAGMFSLYNSPNADRFPLAARFVADGTGNLVFTQVEGDTSSGIAGTGFGEVAGRRSIIQITAKLPVAEWQGKGIVPMLAEDNLSDPQSYTPTYTGFGTVSTSEVEWSRQGKYLIVEGEFVTGTATATEAQISLPNNYTINFKAGTGTKLVGNWAQDANDNSFYYVLGTHGDTFLNVGRSLDGGTDNPLDPANGNQVASGTNRIAFRAKVPVLEFAGSQNSLVGYSEASSSNLGLVKTNPGATTAVVAESMTETITMNGDFTGTAKIAKNGNVVTLTGDGAWTHSSDSIATSLSGLVPAAYRPSATVYTLVGEFGGTMTRLEVQTDGTVQTAYYNSSFTLTNTTSTGGAVTISYVIT